MTTASTDTAAGTYAIDTARSEIRFHAVHAFGLGPVTGTLAVRDGTITVAADPSRSRVTARVDAASFTTDKARRDADVRAKRFLHAQAYPDMVFDSQRLVRDGDGWLLPGQLTVRSTAAPVVLELYSVGADRNGFRVRARTRVDRHAHRVGPRGIVGRYLDIELDIIGKPVPPRAH